MNVIGVDPSATTYKPSGYAILTVDLELLDYGKIISDVELLERAIGWNVSLASIDAPLSLPGSRGYRDCEVKMLRERLRVYPTSISWMKKLALRGIGLAEKFRKAGIQVVETHPSSSLRICGFKGDVRRPLEVRRFIEEKWKINLSRRMDKHVLDAVIAGIAGVCYLRGRSVIFESEDCRIVLACML